MWKVLICVALLTLGFSAVLRAEPSTEPNPAVAGKPGSAEATAVPTPLPADLFRGRVHEAYKAAAEIPDVLAELACYCGCAKSIGHRHLLDCFVDDHGAG